MKKYTLRIFHNTTLNCYIKTYQYSFKLLAVIEGFMTKLIHGYDYEIFTN